MTEKIIVHPVCSVMRLGLKDDLIALLKLCSEQVIVPDSAGCCAFAGDRGFYFPELYKHALKNETKEVNQNRVQGYFSSSLMCELGLSNETSNLYISYLYFLDNISR